jgi:small-conductance mechanosensitive channel
MGSWFRQDSNMSPTIILMNLKSTLYRQEIKQRVLVFVKVLVLIGLVFVRSRYSDVIKEYNIPEGLISALVFYFSANIVIGLSRITLIYLYNKKKRRQNNYRDNFVLGINKFASLLTAIIVFISLLAIFDIPVSQFFTSISIVAAAIAILSKDYISNMINGMILMFSDQLSLNDNIKIAEFKGRIVDITLINVHLMTEDNELIYIPNTTVFVSNVVNYTKRNNRNFTFDFELNPSKIGSTYALEKFLKVSLEPYHESINPESINLKVDKINNDKVLLKIQMTFFKVNKDLEKELKKHIANQILEFVKQFDYMEKPSKPQPIEIGESLD